MGNEYGQILACVLTAAEGSGLEKMAVGLVNRYKVANQSPPKLLYVDRDCCAHRGQSQLQTMFAAWPELMVRLDIWHFMRRFSHGCNSESHLLYGAFTAKLSTCIFEWDADDMNQLMRAKRAELVKQCLPSISDSEVRQRITRRELQKHCRRRTRGVEETTRLIKLLIDVLDSDKGCDTLGVRLLDHQRIQQIWIDQQKHVTCIQDPPDIPLYVVTGSIKKAGVQLNTYRCGRGSTSLESFHNHVKNFIPGNCVPHINILWGGGGYVCVATLPLIDLG